MTRRKSDSPQKAALREMMGNYMKENDVRIKDVYREIQAAGSPCYYEYSLKTGKSKEISEEIFNIRITGR